MQIIINTFLSLGSKTCEIQLAYVWVFIFIIVGMILTNCRKGIGMLSVFGAFYLGVWRCFDVVKESLVLAPSLWIFYCLLGTAIITGLFCSLALDE